MNKYEIDEIFNSAIMTKTAHVLVEGVDDVSIYENLAPDDCEIYAIETIDGYSGGCGAVTDAIKVLNEIDTQGILSKYVVGIIDRDSEFFISGLKNIPGLFTLNQYSIESHFVNDQVLNNLLFQITKISEKQEIPNINTEICIDAIDDVYYFSLEALNSAVDSEYNGIVGYSSNIGRRKDVHTMQSIRLKSQTLDALAATHNLDRNIISLKLLVKGKWLLQAFSEGLEKLIKSLPQQCKSSQIIQCRICKFDVNSSCLFKLKDGINHQSIYSLAMNVKGNGELDYIKDMLQNISHSAKV